MPDALATLGEQVGIRELWSFACSGPMERDDVGKMLAWMIKASPWMSRRASHPCGSATRCLVYRILPPIAAEGASSLSGRQPPVGEPDRRVCLRPACGYLPEARPQPGDDPEPSTLQYVRAPPHRDTRSATNVFVPRYATRGRHRGRMLARTSPGRGHAPSLPLPWRAARIRSDKPQTRGPRQTAERQLSWAP